MKLIKLFVSLLIAQIAGESLIHQLTIIVLVIVLSVASSTLKMAQNNKYSFQ